VVKIKKLYKYIVYFLLLFEKNNFIQQIILY
jgi:hypothetical protein